jgi:hypothetical protein
MRQIKSLSFSSMSLFFKDSEEFYLRYLASNRPDRLPQERPMAAGSAFDAYVKSALHGAIFGTGTDAQFDFQAIFESQVEPQNRDWAIEAGKHIFDCYVRTGAYTDLRCLMENASEPPRFEFSVEGLIDGKVPFLGKPDCRFVIKPAGVLVHIILDFKVKGYCSKYGASPSKGYRLCRDGYESKKQSPSNGTAHKLYLPYDHHGFEINEGYLETCNDEYADQLTLYGWLLGEKPGDEKVVTCIDEIVAKYTGEGSKPLLRVANHRARVSRDHQMKLLSRVTTCWGAITSGHIFRDLARADSDSRCEVLENMAAGLRSDGSDLDKFFNEVTRPQLKR